MIYPPDFTVPESKLFAAQMAAQCIAGLTRDHRGVVQAGGCIGLWPRALASKFGWVWTCEPAPSNVPYLEANIAGIPNITAAHVALGAESAAVGLTRPKPHAGLWRVDGPGDIPMWTIDAMVGDAPIDAIVLDVEGYEAQALCGAARTIERNRPVLWFEYLQHTAAIDSVLSAHGYPPPQPALGGDFYSAPQE